METPLPPVQPTIRKINSLALASGILGIGFVFLALVGLFVPIILFIAFIPGIVGLVLGIIGLVQIGKHKEQTGKGWAIAGIILGVLAILSLCLFPIIGLTLLGPQMGNVFSEINSGLTP